MAAPTGSDQPFTDLTEACDFWQEYLGVSGPEVRGHLERFLAERLTREASGWLAPYSKEALVIWWPVAVPTRGDTEALRAGSRSLR